MRAKEFTTEAKVKPYEHENVDIETAVEYLNKYCSEAVETLENPIFRSMRDHNEPIVYIDTTNSERKSQNTSNHYTLLMDNSPYYAGFPKRSNSLVASSKMNYATSFGGTLYALFPFDGTRIGICPELDIWNTMAKLPEFSNSLHPSFEGIADFCRNYLYLADTAWDTFVTTVHLPRVEKELRYHSQGKIGSEDFIEVLQRGMAPANTGMRVMTMKGYAANPPEHSCEVWFSGKCFAIERSLWERFKDAKYGKPEPHPVVPPKPETLDPWGNDGVTTIKGKAMPPESA